MHIFERKRFKMRVKRILAALIAALLIAAAVNLPGLA